MARNKKISAAKWEAYMKEKAKKKGRGRGISHRRGSRATSPVESLGVSYLSDDEDLKCIYTQTIPSASKTCISPEK